MVDLQSHIEHLQAQSAGPRPPIRIYHCPTGQCVAERVVVANTALKRLRGLLGRRGLAANEALWLRPSNGIHTLGMLFAIDAIFLDKDLRITRVVENLRPFRITIPHLRTRSVLEMAAHSVARLQLKTGDQLRVVRTENA
ncbi:MAG TPA: DUF192 domain-containing protein [Blastocatellia bacterium]|nr:DUF192 domain-containing protein [Blastocatellia bacterium]